MGVTLLRETLTIDGQEYHLAQGTVPATVRNQIVEAVRTGGDFVSVVLVGNRALHLLISPGTRLLIHSVEVADDPRDDGDVGVPFDPDLFG